LLKDDGYPKDKYRLLCYNCNLARAHFFRCPHELKAQYPDPAKEAPTEVPE